MFSDSNEFKSMYSPLRILDEIALVGKCDGKDGMEPGATRSDEAESGSKLLGSGIANRGGIHGLKCFVLLGRKTGS